MPTVLRHKPALNLPSFGRWSLRRKIAQCRGGSTFKGLLGNGLGDLPLSISIGLIAKDSMRKPALCALVALALSGCASVGNFPVATCKSRPNGYALVMHGIRDNGTHSLIMFMLKPKYEANFELLVPRISGQVQGKEVVSASDKAKLFSGEIIFSDGAVVVSLLNGTLNPHPSDWNGRYQLAQCAQ